MHELKHFISTYGKPPDEFLLHFVPSRFRNDDL